jgi:SAM-dependent methyltransferase
VSEAMEAEFDTVAEWTAQVAEELGPEYYVPAACRGSGSPAALDWLIDRMGLAPGQLLLDSGAGVGGPAAYAARSRSVQPVLVEPEAGACRAAKRLFDFPAVRGLGTALPMADSSFDAAWSLGVLCTTPDHLTLLGELRRAVRSGGRIGLLAFVAHRANTERSASGEPLSDNRRARRVGEDGLPRSGAVAQDHRFTRDPPDME